MAAYQPEPSSFSDNVAKAPSTTSPNATPSRRHISLNNLINTSIDTAISEKAAPAHMLITISREPVLWNEQYKPYFKYSYIVDTPHQIPYLISPLDPKLKGQLAFMESGMRMKWPTHMVELHGRNRRAAGTGEIVRVVEVDIMPKFMCKFAVDGEKAKAVGREEKKAHGVGMWLKCKGRKELGVCDCVLDPRTAWGERRVCVIE